MTHSPLATHPQPARRPAIRTLAALTLSVALWASAFAGIRVGLHGYFAHGKRRLDKVLSTHMHFIPTSALVRRASGSTRRIARATTCNDRQGSDTAQEKR